MIIRDVVFIISALMASFQSSALSIDGFDELKTHINLLATGKINPNNFDMVLKKYKISDTKNQDLYINLARVVNSVDERKEKLTLSELEKSMNALAEKKGVIDNEDIIDAFIALVNGTRPLKTVLVVGRTRAGKSTFLSTIKDPLNPLLHKEIAKESIFSHTVSSHDYYVVIKTSEGVYVMRFIDTPGFSEVKSIKEKKEERSDKEIINDIAENIKGKRVDRVLQIIRLGQGINPEDVKAFELINFALAERKIFFGKIDLVIGQMEIEGEKRFENLKQELGMASITKEMVSGKVFPSGTIFDQSFDRGFKDSVLLAAKNTLLFRYKILSDILGTDIYATDYTDEKGNLSDKSSQTITNWFEQLPQFKKKKK